MMLLVSSCFGSCVFVLFLALGIFYIYAKYKLSYWKRRGVPSPPANLIFGNFTDVFLQRCSPPSLMGKLHKDADGDAPFLGLYIFHKPFLILRSPALIKQILIKDFNLFSDRFFAGNEQKDLTSAKGLFAINNPEWKYLRTKMSPVFTSGKLKKMFPLIVESAETMVQFLRGQIDEDGTKKTVEVKSTSSKYTTDVISSLAFGIRTNSFRVPEPEFRTQGVNLTKQSLLSALKLFVLFFFPHLTNLFRITLLGSSAKFFRSLFWDSMNSRELSGNKRGDLIDALVELKNEEQKSDFKFEGDALLAQPVIFFIAGFETSSTTMAFSLLELAKHPEMQERARREVQEQFEKLGTTYEAYQEMKYLAQVISETLRLYPPAPIIDRVALQDYKIPDSDVVIEKGTPVYVILPGLHEDPRYHPEPGRYDPERFSEERKNDIVPFTYMPFGEGPRICIGMKIGILQTAVGLAMILRDYEVTLNPLYNNAIDPRSIFIAFVDGINLNFSRISAK